MSASAVQVERRTDRTLRDLWRESTRGTAWSTLNVNRELDLIESKAVRPRIPDDHLIFRVFRAFSDPKKQIKVVLLGQDPYPEMLSIPADPDAAEAAGTEFKYPKDAVKKGEKKFVSRACGFSFSSPLGGLPFSLRIMIAEVLREYPQPAVIRTGKAPRVAVASDYSGDLAHLVGDGVFLLNTFLTLARDPNPERNSGLPKTHTSWICFTTQILKFIHRTCPNAVYLALGKQAADILKASDINDAITTDHPANARFGGRTPFAGSDIFRQCNQLLERRGVKAVEWVPMLTPIDTTYYDLQVAPVENAGEIDETDQLALAESIGVGVEPSDIPLIGPADRGIDDQEDDDCEDEVEDVEE